MSWQVGLYLAAVFLPLAAFVVELIGIRVLGRLNAYVATGAIALAFVLSLVGFLDYFFVEAEGVFSGHHVAQVAQPAEADRAHAAEPGEGGAEAPHGEAAAHDGHEHGGAHGPVAFRARYDWVVLGAEPGPPGGAAGRPALVIPLGVHVDNLTVIIFLMVTFIATLIHIYSMGYMSDDPGYPRFFAYLSLFCFSMLGLVASSSIFMVFVFWELVGVCSYLLIGFWYEEKKNSDAANKAFIVNRVGDVGMLVGLGLIWTSLGTFSIQDVNRALSDTQLRHEETGRLAHAVTGAAVRVHVVDSDAPAGAAGAEQTRTIPYWVLTVAGLGIFAGCVGKSAQFPLHVWLPDAMAGPTPVSALIHAATMVAAGVYLVGRFYPLFNEEVLLYIAYTGAITLFIAASIAIVQTDYKKVLAYSTVSQLGYMMLGLGVGGWAAGLFHLLTHAFFKALLFLGAGSVFHSVHTYEMPVLGGLLKKMPITGYTMLAATLAISGVPFFSGFYSKDAILAAALYRVSEDPQHLLLFVIPTVGAAMTAFYMFRLWFLVFAGESRGYPALPGAAHGAGAAAAHDHGHGLDYAAAQAAGHGHAPSHAPGHGHAPAHGHDAHHVGNPVEHAHESPPIMAWPLIALAIPTVFAGWTVWLGLPIGEPVLEQMIAYGSPLRAIDLHAAHLYAMVASILVATAGIGLGVLYYAPPLPYFFSRRFEARRAAERFGGLHKFLVHKWYFDELYDAVFVRPALALARAASWFDRKAIDGLVNGSASVTAGLSRLQGFFDNFAVDGLVNLTARGVYLAGDYGRALQTGRLRSYLAFLAVAVVGLFVGVYLWII